MVIDGDFTKRYCSQGAVSCGPNMHQDVPFHIPMVFNAMNEFCGFTFIKKYKPSIRI